MSTTKTPVEDRRMGLFNKLMQWGLSHEAAEGIVHAFAWRGTHTGFLQARQPSATKDPTGAGAWLALTLEANPMKVRAGSIMGLGKQAKDVFAEITEAFETGVLGGNLATIDRDRAALERAGAY